MDKSNQASIVYRVDEVLSSDLVRVSVLQRTNTGELDSVQTEEVSSAQMAASWIGTYWVESPNFFAQVKSPQDGKSTLQALISSASGVLPMQQLATPYASKLHETKLPDFVRPEPSNLREGNSKTGKKIAGMDLDSVPSAIRKIEFALKLATGLATDGEESLVERLTGEGLDVGNWRGEYLVFGDQNLVSTSDLTRFGSKLTHNSGKLQIWSFADSSNFFRDQDQYVFASNPRLYPQRLMDLRSEEQLLDELDRVVAQVELGPGDTRDRIQKLVREVEGSGLGKDDLLILTKLIEVAGKRIQRAEQLADAVMSSQHVQEMIAQHVELETNRIIEERSSALDSAIEEKQAVLNGLMSNIESMREELKAANEEKAITEEVARRTKLKSDEQEQDVLRRLQRAMEKLDQRFDDRAMLLDDTTDLSTAIRGLKYNVIETPRY